ncbi:MAG TPA: VanW family protein [Polyangiaceae bacterium]|nr:VanW family protein [Polyangiaceae bacterium]
MAKKGLISLPISFGRAQRIALVCLPVVFVVAFALAFARFAGSQRVLSGVSVAGVQLGGNSRDEAEHKLRELAQRLATQKLRLELAGKQAVATAAELGLELDVAASTARALATARSGGVTGNAVAYLRAPFGSTSLPGVVRVDSTRFARALAQLEPQLIDDPPFVGGLVVEGGVPRLAAARPGRKIAVTEARAACQDALALGGVGTPLRLLAKQESPHLSPASLERALEQAKQLLRAPITLEAEQRRLQIEPAELGGLLATSAQGEELTLSIDPAKVDAWLAPRRANLEAPARDASFEVSANDEVRVTPSEAGIQLRAADIARALLEAGRDSHHGSLPLSHEPQPKRTSEQARQLGITKLVSSFTTRHDCCQPRVDNIHRIATLLDGLVVPPGETVSINAVVGPRTQKNGFVLAPSIEDGEMVDSVGGGVSQFATTIFNALFHGGYDIIERQPHSYWFTRYPMGHDATLGYPHPDIVFKNDTAAGLLIKTSFSKTTITVKLYGDNGGRRVSSSVSERRDIVQPVVELLPNRAVAPDEEKVKEGGMIGWSVIASRTVTFSDGTKKEEKRKVTYKPKPRRVEVHPCRIPKGEPGATGEKCPEIEPEPETDATPEAAASPP